MQIFKAMKIKIYNHILIFLISNSLTIFGQNVYFPDSGFKHALILQGIDTSGDGEISISEAEAVASIDISNSNIYDLTGIEAFINITTLTCTNNQLSSIDLSSNPYLLILECGHNYIQNLVISANTALGILDCSNNHLTSLNISNNTSLLELDCDSCNLTTLNLSNNINLKRLDCDKNSLNNLDISANIALTELDCDNNNLSSIDLSQNIALINLDCAWNNLTRLNLTNNPDIKYLKCAHNKLSSLNVVNNHQLIEIDCDYNDLSSINVTNNILLERFDCDYNDLTELNVKNNIGLIELDCDSNKLSVLDISNNINLRIIRLRDMENLYTVYVWELPFPPDSVKVSKKHSPITFKIPRLWIEFTEQAGCLGKKATFILNSDGVETNSFQWKKNGTDLLGETHNTFTINNLSYDNSGNYECIVNGTYSISRRLDVYKTPDYTVTAPQLICYNETATIAYSGDALNNLVYNWYFDNGTIVSGNNIDLFGIQWNSSGEKQISLHVNNNGCTSDTTLLLTVKPKTHPISICMVGVDSLNHNMVIWEQPSTNAFDSILIYKETSQTDVYSKIGSQSANDLSVFIDSQSNPARNSSRYKIAVLDTCGYETLLSSYHKTMHLTINAGIGGSWNLIWDKYEGFNYSTFNIYRGTSANNLLLIAEQAGNTFTFTDLTPPVGTLFYQIEVVNPNPCDISNFIKSTYNYYGVARSNMVNSNQTNAVDEFSLENIDIFPNPAKNKIIIDLQKQFEIKNTNILIYNIHGQLVMQQSANTLKPEINIAGLANGIYIVKVLNAVNSSVTRFVKE
jgi:hypothetical protein